MNELIRGNNDRNRKEVVRNCNGYTQGIYSTSAVDMSSQIVYDGIMLNISMVWGSGNVGS